MVMLDSGTSHRLAVSKSATWSVNREMSTPCTLALTLFAICFSSCQRQIGHAQPKSPKESSATSTPGKPLPRNTSRVIHVVVALCDNTYQGIVPVSPALGNGDDPPRNLYWGAAYGVKSFFRKAQDWSLVADMENPRDRVLERVVFKHKTKDVYLVADAYRGRNIKQGTFDFLSFAAGNDSETIEVRGGTSLYAGGSADLIAYVGHDGLMDFSLDQFPQKSDDRNRSAIILACISKSYFREPIKRTGAKPLLWTTGLMAPESYILKAAIDGWILNESDEKIRERAAGAYNKYQKCGPKAALNLFSTGW
jgi:hypothetical protein